MPSMDEVLSSIARLNATPKTILPPTPTTPATSGYCGALGDTVISRVSDRVRAREATTPEVVPQRKSPAQLERERLMKVYGEAYEKEESAKKAEQTRRQRVAAEKRRVDEAHRLDDIRMAETKREMKERNSRIAV